MIERVRAVLVTANDELLTIRRVRPGVPTYRVLPGGHVEPTDASLEDALAREIREELAATIQVRSLVYVTDGVTDRQYFFLARIDRWAFDERTGPEFAEAGRGEYGIDLIPLTADAVASSDLKPDGVATFLRDALTRGDLFTLPDRRDSEDLRESRAQ